MFELTESTVTSWLMKVGEQSSLGNLWWLQEAWVEYEGVVKIEVDTEVGVFCLFVWLLWASDLVRFFVFRLGIELRPQQKC